MSSIDQDLLLALRLEAQDNGIYDEALLNRIEQEFTNGQIESVTDFLTQNPGIQLEPTIEIPDIEPPSQPTSSSGYRVGSLFRYLCNMYQGGEDNSAEQDDDLNSELPDQSPNNPAFSDLHANFSNAWNHYSGSSQHPQNTPSIGTLHTGFSSNLSNHSGSSQNAPVVVTRAGTLTNAINNLRSTQHNLYTGFPMGGTWSTWNNNSGWTTVTQSQFSQQILDQLSGVAQMMQTLNDPVTLTLTEKALDALANLTYNQVKEKLPELDLEEGCSICFDKLVTDCENHTYIVLPCNHPFHSDCIKEYLTNYNYHCPICKTECGEHKANI